MRSLEAEVQAGRTDRGWVMVTGAGSGIGSALTEVLIERGYHVMGSAISVQEEDALSARHPQRFMPLLMDVRSSPSTDDAARRAAGLLGQRPLRGLFNVAGVISNGPLADLGAVEFANLLATNVIGVHNTTKSFLPLLTRSRDGRIVNMSSASGTRTLPFTGAYSASKFAVEALSSAMRMEFAPLGLSVATVAPGMVRTPMAERIQAELRRAPSLPVYRVPLQRFLAGAVRATEHGIPMARIVATLLAALEDGRPKLRYVVNNSFLHDVVLAKWLPMAAREAVVCKALGLR